MSLSLTVRLGELVQTLNALQQRFHQTARLEVARTISEALREAALALIGGWSRYPPTRSLRSWDDPWQDDGEVANADLDDEMPSGQVPRPSPWPGALAVGLGVAHWSWLRSRYWPAALAIGLLAAVAVYAGGPVVAAGLGRWSTANDAVRLPGLD